MRGFTQGLKAKETPISSSHIGGEPIFWTHGVKVTLGFGPKV